MVPSKLRVLRFSKFNDSSFHQNHQNVVVCFMCSTALIHLRFSQDFAFPAFNENEVVRNEGKILPFSGKAFNVI